MKDKVKGIAIAAAAIAALAIGGAAIAGAAGGDSQTADQPASEQAAESSGAGEAAENESGPSEAAEQATGATADDAAKAALAEVGGGQVLEVEHADDGESGYEVEVERTDGSYVEVNLDNSLDVVSTGTDD